MKTSYFKNRPPRIRGEYYRVDAKIGAASRTKQSFSDECDINMIMAKWQRTGMIDHIAAYPPTYGDFNSAGEYQQALNQVIAAQDAFDALSSKVRTRMGNDPGVFMDFMMNPENEAEAIKLGLVKAPKQEAKRSGQNAPPEPKTPPKSEGEKPPEPKSV